MRPVLALDREPTLELHSTAQHSTVQDRKATPEISTHLEQNSVQAHEQLHGRRQHPQHTQQLLQAARHILC